MRNGYVAQLSGTGEFVRVLYTLKNTDRAECQPMYGKNPLEEQLYK
jgi:hypothetical protein